MKAGALIVIVVLVLMAGCISVGRKIDQASVDKIKKGETTKEQVLEWLGSPDQITRDGNGNVTFRYHYVRATPKPETFIPIVGAFVGGSNVQNQFLLVSFGPDGIVKRLYGSYGATEADRGLATGGHADMPDVEEGKRPK